MSIEEWQEEQGRLPDEPTPYTIPVPSAPDVPTTKAPDVPTINQRQYNLPQFSVPNVPAPNAPSSNAQYIMSQYNRWAQQPQYAIHQNLNTGFGIPQQQLWSNQNYNPDIHGSWGETEANAPGSIDLMQLSSSGLSYYGKGGWAGNLAPGIGEEQASKLLSGEYSEGYPLSAWDFLNEWPGDDAGGGGGGYGGYGSGSGYGNWGGPSYSIASGSPRYSSWGLVMWRIT